MHKLRIQTICRLPAQTSDLSFVQPIHRLSTCLPTHYLMCHMQTLQRREEHAGVRSNGTLHSIQKWSKQTYLSANKVGSRIIHGLSCLKFRSKVCTGQSLDCPGNPWIVLAILGLAVNSHICHSKIRIRGLCRTILELAVN